MKLYMRRRILVEIHDERLRQMVREGFTTDHDDSHTSGELSRAAACYAMAVGAVLELTDGFGLPAEKHKRFAVPDAWPWERQSWKPKDPRRDLVRAAALILAEIERMDRASGAAKGEKS